MSNRERWIIYPLLFFSVAAVLKPQLFPPQAYGEHQRFSCKHLVCESLSIEDGQGKPRVRIGVTPSSDGTTAGFAHLKLIGNQKKPILALGADPRSGCGKLETFTDEGKPQVELGSTPIGGFLSLWEGEYPWHILVAPMGRGSGMFVEDSAHGSNLLHAIDRSKRQPAKPPENTKRKAPQTDAPDGDE